MQKIVQVEYMKMIIGVENTFEADYMYVTLYNWMETLCNELQIYKVEPCNIHTVR